MDVAFVSIGRTLYKLIFNRYVMGALAIGLSIWLFYSWAHNNGAKYQKSIDDPIIAALNYDLTKARDTIDKARQELKAANDAHEVATKNLKEAQQTTLLLQKAKLDEAEKELSKQKGKVNELSRKLVTPKADAACVIPAGFVRLHDESAKGPLPVSATATAGPVALPGGGQPDVDSPTTVALSTVGETIAYNYAEAHFRGVLLKAWQDWYIQSYADWKQAVIEQGYKPIEIPLSPIRLKP